jgi:hypothetical protein
MTPGPDWVTDDWTVGGLNEDARHQDFEHALAFAAWTDGLKVRIERTTTNGDPGLWAVDRTKILHYIAQESTVVAVGAINVQILFQKRHSTHHPSTPFANGEANGQTVLALHEHAGHLDVKQHFTAALWALGL